MTFCQDSQGANELTNRFTDTLCAAFTFLMLKKLKIRNVVQTRRN